jgi:hypothetical protein
MQFLAHEAEAAKEKLNRLTEEKKFTAHVFNPYRRVPLATREETRTSERRYEDSEENINNDDLEMIQPANETTTHNHKKGHNKKSPASVSLINDQKNKSFNV